MCIHCLSCVMNKFPSISGKIEYEKVLKIRLNLGEDTLCECNLRARFYWSTIMLLKLAFLLVSF